MKKLSYLILSVFLFGLMSAGSKGHNSSDNNDELIPILVEKGKPKTKQNGDGTLTLYCNWQWWKTCFTFHSEGYIELGDGRIIYGADIIDETHYDDSTVYEHSCVYTVEYDTIVTP